MELLTAKQLSKAMNVSEKTVRRLRKAGKIPALCISDDTATVKHYRFILSDVIKELKEMNKTKEK